MVHLTCSNTTSVDCTNAIRQIVARSSYVSALLRCGIHDMYTVFIPFIVRRSRARFRHRFPLSSTLTSTFFFAARFQFGRTSRETVDQLFRDATSVPLTPRVCAKSSLRSRGKVLISLPPNLHRGKIVDRWKLWPSTDETFIECVECVPVFTKYEPLAGPFCRCVFAETFCWLLTCPKIRYCFFIF